MQMRFWSTFFESDFLSLFRCLFLLVSFFTIEMSVVWNLNFLREYQMNCWDHSFWMKFLFYDFLTIGFGFFMSLKRINHIFCFFFFFIYPMLGCVLKYFPHSKLFKNIHETHAHKYQYTHTPTLWKQCKMQFPHLPNALHKHQT